MTSTLIIGATGLLGSEMAKASARNGDSLHVLVRPATSANEERMRPLKALGATVHVGDLDNYDSLVRAVGRVDRDRVHPSLGVGVLTASTWRRLQPRPAPRVTGVGALEYAVVGAGIEDRAVARVDGERIQLQREQRS